MVIVVQDVDAPAFDNAGRRTVIHLKAGNALRPIKEVDGHNVLCSSGWPQSRFFLVVPASLLRVAQDPSTRQKKSFVNFLRKFKPEEVEKGGWGEDESEEDESVSPEEAEKYVGAPASIVTIPGDIDEKSFKKIFKGYDYEYLDRDRRFLMTSAPIKGAIGGIQRFKKKDPKTGRLTPSELGVVRYYDDKGKEVNLEQIKKMQTEPRAEWVGLYQVIDTKTGETFAADSKSDAERQVDHRLQYEISVAAPEFSPYGGLVIQRVVDPEAKSVTFNVRGDEGGPNLNPSPLGSQQDIENYIRDNIEQLITKVMG